MREKIVAANWKMHGNPDWAETYGEQLASELAAHGGDADCHLFSFLSFVIATCDSST